MAMKKQFWIVLLVLLFNQFSLGTTMEELTTTGNGLSTLKKHILIDYVVKYLSIPDSIKLGIVCKSLFRKMTEQDDVNNGITKIWNVIISENVFANMKYLKFQLTLSQLDGLSVTVVSHIYSAEMGLIAISKIDGSRETWRLGNSDKAQYDILHHIKMIYSNGRAFVAGPSLITIPRFLNYHLVKYLSIQDAFKVGILCKSLFTEMIHQDHVPAQNNNRITTIWHVTIPENLFVHMKYLKFQLNLLQLNELSVTLVRDIVSISEWEFTVSENDGSVEKLRLLNLKLYSYKVVYDLLDRIKMIYCHGHAFVVMD